MNTGRPIAGQCAQWHDIVEHVEAAAVGGDHQFVAVDRDVAHRGRGQAALQRLPVAAVVERDVKAALGPGEQQARPDRIFADDIDRVGPAFGRQAIDDRRPVSAAVARSEDVRPLVVEPVTVDRRIGRRSDRNATAR